MRMTLKSALLGCCALLGGGVGHSAYAQQQAATSNSDAGASAEVGSGQLEEIVVTAQKRSENIQKVPLSVVAFSADALATRAINTLSDLGPSTPGLQADPSNGVVLPFLRGVGSTLTAVGNESSVGVYVDGVYYTRVLPGLLSLNNVERVEVLKGPQGTLFGRNSTAGVIQIVTPLPTEELQVRGHVGYGNYDTLSGDVYLSGGLGDGVALDLAVTGNKQGEGFGRNLVTGNRTWYYDDITARSKLLIKPTDTTQIVLSGYYTYVKSSSLASGLPGTTQGYSSAPFGQLPTVGFFDQNTDTDNFFKSEQYGGSLTIDQELGFANLKSITAYSKNVEDAQIDSDRSPRPDNNARLPSEMNQFTQEFQLTSAAGSDLKWVLGAFYYDTTSAYTPLELRGPFHTPGDVIGDAVENGLNFYGKQKVRSASLFGQATYEVLPRLKLTGGMRYIKEKISGASRFTAVSANSEFVILDTDDSYKQSKVVFKAALDYELSADALGFASFSRGFKSGGYSLAPLQRYRAETIDAYEVGLKTKWLDNRLRLNVSAFWYDIGSPQVQIFVSPGIIVANAGSQRVKGAELDGAFLLTPGLTLNFGASYLDSKYRKFDDALVGVPLYTLPFGTAIPLGSINAAGFRTPLGSKFTGAVGAVYKFSSDVGEWSVAADYAYNDGYFYEPNNQFRQKAFSLVNANIEVRPTEHMSVGLWAKNIFDKRYITFATTQVGPPGFPYSPGAPRRYGVKLGFEF